MSPEETTSYVLYIYEAEWITAVQQLLDQLKQDFTYKRNQFHINA